MRTYLWSSIAVAWIVPSIAHAQLDNTVGVTVEFAPYAALEGDAGLESPPEVGYRNVRANLIAPVEIEDWDAVLFPGMSYRLYAPRIRDPFVPDGPDQLHDLNLRFGVLKNFGDTWSLAISLGAGLATDFQDLEADHLRYQGLAAVRYDTGGSWLFGLGAVFTYWFGEPLALPAVQVIYRGDRWNADVSLPRLANLRYRIVEGVEIGVLGQVDGNRFSLGEDLPVESVSLSIADVGAVAGVQLAGPVWLTAYAGATVLRRYDYLDEDNAELVNLDQARGPIFRLGIVLQPERE